MLSFAAGDFVKFNFPMASSVTVLAWGVLQFREGYVRAAELQNVLDSIRWPLDYFIKCHTANNELYGQVRVSMYSIMCLNGILYEVPFYGSAPLMGGFL